MKRLISAGILLVIVIAAYFTSNWYIEKACNEIKSKVKICEETYSESLDSTVEYAKKLQKDWDDKEQILSLFVNHKDIDEIEMSITDLISFSKTDESAFFYNTCSKLKMQLHQIMEDITFSAHSVL